MTCLGAAHAMLARTSFDVCVVDEATQVKFGYQHLLIIVFDMYIFLRDKVTSRSWD